MTTEPHRWKSRGRRPHLRYVQRRWMGARQPPALLPPLRNSDGVNLRVRRPRLFAQPLHHPVDAVAAPPVQLQGSSQTGATEPVVAAAGETVAMGPAAVIGRRFPVSASVTAGCKSDGGCPELDEELAKFAQEPRDLAWAADIEARMRQRVMANSSEFTIRSLECRTSLCAIEAASFTGGFTAGTALNPTLRPLLFVGSAGFGIERDASSAKIVVTLLTYERR